MKRLGLAWLVVVMGCSDANTSSSGKDAGGDVGVSTDAGMDTEVTDGGQGCDPACTSGVCDPASNTCVACLTHAQCGGDTPACDTSTKTCVACVADEQCGLGPVGRLG